MNKGIIDYERIMMIREETSRYRPTEGSSYLLHVCLGFGRTQRHIVVEHERRIDNVGGDANNARVLEDGRKHVA